MRSSNRLAEFNGIIKYYIFFSVFAFIHRYFLFTHARARGVACRVLFVVKTEMLTQLYQVKLSPSHGRVAV